MKKGIFAILLSLSVISLLIPGKAGRAYTPEKKVVRIGFVGDGPSAGRLDLNEEVFKREILEVTRDEFDVRFPREKTLFADMTREGINRAIDRLLQDPNVDIIITLGSVSSNEISTRGELPKPVIAPIVIDVELQGLPIVRGTSGVKNLTYITSFKKAARDVKIFRGMVPFSRLTVVVDRLLLETIPKIQEISEKISRENSIEISIVPATDSAEAVLEALGPETEAVFLSPLVRFNPVEFDRLAKGLIEKKLPSFSLWGRSEVEQAILAAVSPKSDITRLARRVALNVQRILIGEDPATFQVALLQTLQLSINMATARAIGFSPSWSVLTEAVLLNEEPPQIARRISLLGAIEEAIDANLDIAVAGKAVAAGEQVVREARSFLFPRIDIFAQGLLVDEDRAASSLGSQAERTLSGSATLSQLLYSEDAWSNLEVQRQTQVSREEDLERVRLDIALDGATDYLNLMKAKTNERIQMENLKVTRSNLNLARIRETIGYSGQSDVIRWESQIATDKKAVLDSRAARKVAETILNRTLHRPLGERFQTEETDLDDPALMVYDQRLSTFVDNPAHYATFSDFMVRDGLMSAPELKGLDADIAGQERILLSARRAFWLPTFTLQADVTEIFSEGGAGSEPISLGPLVAAFPESDDTFWSVSLLLSFPLFEGGAKKATLTRTKEELSGLNLERLSAAEKVEERIRTALILAAASFTGIELSRDAAIAARKNLDLVTDSYSRGAVSIIDLLDAQNAALAAELGEANSLYDFLIDLMGVQRASGRFYVFMSDEERDAWFGRLETYFLDREVGQ